MAGTPQGSLDDWPAPKEIRSFFFCRFRSYEEPKHKAKIEQAEKDFQKKNQTRLQIIESLKAKRSERAYVISHLKPLTGEVKQYRMVIDEMRKEMEPLTTALSKLRNVNGTGREKGVSLCSSVEELDNLIRSLQYRIQHESNTLSEEKQLVKEIKQLEGTREKVMANAAMKAKIQEVLGQKEAIQDQVKLIGVDMDTVRKELQAVRTQIKGLEEELKAIDDEIGSLQDELAVVTEKRNKAYDALSKLRKERDAENACFYQNRSVLTTAKFLAAKKDIAALEELCGNEMEKFMSQWNGSKAFRDDYERRILTSLDMRQLRRDGRIRNPGEKTIMAELQPAKPSQVKPSEITTKPAKEVAAPLSRHDVVGTCKAREEVSKLTEAELKGKYDRLEDRKDAYEIGKPQEVPKAKERDLATLRDMKREEEMVKAKQAMERKKKLAEKATAKAAARAQREAEKKMKEKEKRAKKKVGTSEPAVSAEETRTETKSPEPEEAEVMPEVPVPVNTKEQKQKIKRSKVSDPLSMRILKRKKSHSTYPTWAAVVAAIVVLICAVVGWYYFGRN